MYILAGDYSTGNLVKCLLFNIQIICLIDFLYITKFSSVKCVAVSYLAMDLFVLSSNQDSNMHNMVNINVFTYKKASEGR